MLGSVFKNRKRTDLVLIDTYSTQNFYYALWTARLCRALKLPYIPILRGGDLPQRLKNNAAMCKELFGKAHLNIAPSRYIQHEFATGGFTNVLYIPNSIDLKKYPFLQRKSVAPKLLWVRAFAEIYNPLLALQIVEVFVKEGIEVDLCMVGPDKDGSKEASERLVNELQLPVAFAGLMSKPEWVALSKEYDIFLNTTNFDNMPVSVMEAMALGLPVVSTHVGGMPFLIQDGVDGILLPPQNPQAFVDAIKELMRNPLKVENMTRMARAKIERHDWEVVKEKWKEVLGNGPPE